MQGLTQPRRRVLDFIHDHFQRMGYPPSYREIGAFMGYSPKTVRSIESHIRFIEKKGYITRGAAGNARSLSLTDKAKALYPQMGVLPEGVRYYTVLNTPFHVTGLERIA